MAWLRRFGRFLGGIGRAVFGAPGKAWPLVRWLILLGLLSASFMEEVRDWVAAHPWIAALGLISYGAILYAYDLQVRLEKTNSAEVVLDDPPSATFMVQEQRPAPGGHRTLKNVIHIRLEYKIRNGGDAAVHPFPEVRWLRRLPSSRKWRELSPEPVIAPMGARLGGIADTLNSESFGRGRYLEIPARQISTWWVAWEVAFPDEHDLEQQELLLEVIFRVVGQEPQVGKLPLRLILRSS